MNMQKIVIIGGGVSGILSLNKLINDIPPSSVYRIYLIEKEKQFGGLAYQQAALPGLLMNTYIQNMSGPDNNQNHLLNWLNHASLDKSQWGKYADIKWTSSDFCPRNLYGLYIQDIFIQAKKKAAQKNIAVTVIRAIAENITLVPQNKVEIKLNNNMIIAADHVIVCVGQSPASLSITKSIENNPNYIDHFWSEQGLNKFNDISVSDDILIVGSSLTSDDILSLRYKKMTAHQDNNLKSFGHNYRISRHGLSHMAYSKNYQPWSNLPLTLPKIKDLKFNEIVAVINREAANWAKKGIHSEEIYYKFVQQLLPIWSALSHQEQIKIFNVYHYLNVFSTGISHQIHQHSKALLDQNQLTVLKGEIQSIVYEEDQFVVKINHSDKTIKVKYIVNATGFDNNPGNFNSPLIKQLSTMCDSHYLNIGFDVSDDCRVKAKNLLKQPPIYVVGALGAASIFMHTGQLFY